jgi:hypothetical protein
MPLPFLQRAIHESNKNKYPFDVMFVKDELYERLKIPEAVEKDMDKRAAIMLISSFLCMQIREGPDEEIPSKRDVWVPPRDINDIREKEDNNKNNNKNINDHIDDLFTNIMIMPDEVSCYVTLFLSDLTFVSLYKQEESKQTFLEYVLDSSPMVRRAWQNFKDSFQMNTALSCAAI